MKTRQQIKQQIKSVMWEKRTCCDEDQFNTLVKLEKQLRVELNSL